MQHHSTAVAIESTNREHRSFNTKFRTQRNCQPPATTGFAALQPLASATSVTMPTGALSATADVAAMQPLASVTSATMPTGALSATAACASLQPSALETSVAMPPPLQRLPLPTKRQKPQTLGQRSYPGCTGLCHPVQPTVPSESFNDWGGRG